MCGYIRMLSALYPQAIRLVSDHMAVVIRLNGGHDPLLCMALCAPHLFPGVYPPYSEA